MWLPASKMTPNDPCLLIFTLLRNLLPIVLGLVFVTNTAKFCILNTAKVMYVNLMIGNTNFEPQLSEMLSSRKEFYSFSKPRLCEIFLLIKYLWKFVFSLVI